jgi:uncharacterized protein
MLTASLRRFRRLRDDARPILQRFAFEDFDPRPMVRLLILQPTPFCNIRCDYCYLPERDSMRRMPLEVVEATVCNVVSSGLLGREMTIVWHAGEPLVMPVDFYREAFNRIRGVVGNTVTLSHSIQTNAILIDDAWCKLFSEFDVHVGVSVDGPAHIHDRHRKTRIGRGTHREVMAGIARLQACGIPFHAIAVVTRDALDHADEIFGFFADHSITDVGFNIDEAEGVNAHSTLEGEESRYRDFLARMLDLSIASGACVRVRELVRARHAILYGVSEYRYSGVLLPDNGQVMPFVITSVDCAGNFSTFSPELIGQTAPEYRNFILGNVLRDRLCDVIAGEDFHRLFTAVFDGVMECRRNCQYFSLCGGGAPANKYYENGTLASAETAYCRNMIQAPIDLVLARLERDIGASS